jgi:hypothetical protein
MRTQQILADLASYGLMDDAKVQKRKIQMEREAVSAMEIHN